MRVLRLVTATISLWLASGLVLVRPDSITTGGALHALLGPASAPLAHAEDDAPPPEQTPPDAKQPSDQPSDQSGSDTQDSRDDGKDQDTANDKSQDASGDDAQDGGKEPEGVRRKRPHTADDERAYKQRKSREDPFLNPSLTGGQDNGPALVPYNAADWLITDVKPSLSRYIAQDKAGQVLGYLSISIELQDDPVLGNFIHLSLMRDFAAPYITELWLYESTLKPRLKRQNAQKAGSAPTADTATGTPASLSVDYLFDRVNVTEDAGGVTVARQMRQLPFSFDVDELALLVRQVDFRRQEWPFEATLTDPVSLRELPLQISAPQLADVLSAEPETYGCFQFTVRWGAEQQTWWVQRLAPRRLVKFSQGELTYTLMQYSEPQP